MDVRKQLKQRRRMLMIGQAAAMCSVTTQTLRNWDQTGRSNFKGPPDHRIPLPPV